jgi:hypothetical protein
MELLIKTLKKQNLVFKKGGHQFFSTTCELKKEIS